MQNYHGIVVKYLPTTNTRGSRVKLISARFKDSVTLSYDYEYNHCVDMAAAWLKDHGQVIAGQCEINNNRDVILLEAIDGRFVSLSDMKKM